MTNPCQPGAPALAITNPCAYLPVLRGALYALMGGQARAEVRFGEQTLRFHPGNVAEMRKEITKLETMCRADGTENHQGRAVQAGPRRAVGFLGNRRPYY